MSDHDLVDGQPWLRVVRGNPDEVELAALTAVVAALASSPAAGSADQPARSRWSDPAIRLRAPLQPGPGAWRAARLPR